MLLFALAFLPATLVLAQHKLTRELKQEYRVTAGSHIILENIYGSINIKDWDKKFVAIHIIISVESRDRRTAERSMESIEVEFSKVGEIIKAITKVDKRFGNMQSGIFSSNGNRLSIDYTVNMPRNLKIDISQKFGDVFITELNGEMKVEVQYGNFNANKLSRGNVKPLASVTMAYSEGNIAEANWLDLNLKFSGLRIERAHTLNFDTEYSRIFAEDISSITAISKYDRYTLGILNYLDINSKFTNINAERLNKRLEIEASYGGVGVDKIPAGFETLKVNSSYGNITLGIEPTASYMLTGYAAFGKINFPSTGRVNLISGNTDTRVNGFVGTNEKTKSEVIITTRFGNVNLYR